MKELKIVGLFGDRRVSIAWQSLFTNPKLTVKQLADSAGLSESRLEHLVAEHAGTTIRNVKNRLKIERLIEARRQLLETTDPLIDIQERASSTMGIILKLPHSCLGPNLGGRSTHRMCPHFETWTQPAYLRK